MNVSELLTALQSSPPESSVAIRLPDGTMLDASALHVGAGGDAAGVTWLETAPQNSNVIGGEEDISNMGDIDSMAMQAGVDIGKGKYKPTTKRGAPKPATEPDDEDEDDAA